jgi:hypothetical protein
MVFWLMVNCLVRSSCVFAREEWVIDSCG